jgi:hypothetical protein
LGAILEKNLVFPEGKSFTPRDKILLYAGMGSAYFTSTSEFQ